MAEYASKGVAGTGLGLGAAGLGLGLINSGLLGPGGLFGGWNNCSTGWNGCNPAAANAACSENALVNRYEAGLQAQIATKDSQIALRDANTYNDQKLLEVYKYFDGQLKDVRDTLCAQAVHNQKTEDSFALASQDIASVRRELTDQIKLEAERRCCADNSIINYANATFYPKMVADVTVGTETTAQTLYNPIPDCGCKCGR